MKQTLILLPLIAGLAACGKADGELNPGNWKSTMAMTKFEIPGAPPEVAARAQAMLGQSQTTEACMDAAQAKLGVREMSSSMQQGDCTMQDFQQAGGTMSGTMVCKGAGSFGAPQMAMAGSYTPDKVIMTLSGDVKDDKIPGGKASLQMTLTSERTGDCKG
ncbi:DUF3617 domain-containing protein [Erythrobacter colymbi]|uniref:DUF3617 domain-containing protein n=1 Tax=Erythrobacter colymbi TaxID=1161202 RepID=UPI00138FEEBF|nr:DUF3617 domain-containing protein [Erythrobacter colymbi]